MVSMARRPWARRREAAARARTDQHPAILPWPPTFRAALPPLATSGRTMRSGYPPHRMGWTKRCPSNSAKEDGSRVARTIR